MRLEPRRRQGTQVHPEFEKPARSIAIGDDGCGQFSGSRCGLDPGAALARQPEKMRDQRVEANDHGAIRDEGSQTGPRRAHNPDIDCRVGVDAVDGKGYVERLGPDVAGVGGILFTQRTEKLASIGAKIEFIVGVADERPSSPRLVARHCEGGTPHRL